MDRPADPPCLAIGGLWLVLTLTVEMVVGRATGGSLPVGIASAAGRGFSLGFRVVREVGPR